MPRGRAGLALQRPTCRPRRAPHSSGRSSCRTGFPLHEDQNLQAVAESWGGGGAQVGAPVTVTSDAGRSLAAAQAPRGLDSGNTRALEDDGRGTPMWHQTGGFTPLLCWRAQWSPRSPGSHPDSESRTSLTTSPSAHTPLCSVTNSPPLLPARVGTGGSPGRGVGEGGPRD